MDNRIEMIQQHDLSVYATIYSFFYSLLYKLYLMSRGGNSKSIRTEAINLLKYNKMICAGQIYGGSWSNVKIGDKDESMGIRAKITL